VFRRIPCTMPSAAFPAPITPISNALISLILFFARVSSIRWNVQRMPRYSCPRILSHRLNRRYVTELRRFDAPGDVRGSTPVMPRARAGVIGSSCWRNGSDAT
jgi:hypothetical protein